MGDVQILSAIAGFSLNLMGHVEILCAIAHFFRVGEGGCPIPNSLNYRTHSGEHNSVADALGIS